MIEIKTSRCNLKMALKIVKFDLLDYYMKNGSYFFSVEDLDKKHYELKMNDNVYITFADGSYSVYTIYDETLEFNDINNQEGGLNLEYEENMMANLFDAVNLALFLGKSSEYSFLYITSDVYDSPQFKENKENILERGFDKIVIIDPADTYKVDGA